MPATEVAYWAAIGWCLYFARGRRNTLAVLAVATSAILLIDYSLYEGLNASVAVYLAPLPLLAWRVQWPLPAAVSAALSYVALNSYAIYLLHDIPTFVSGQYGVSLLGQGFAGELLPLSIGLAFPLAVATLARRLIRSSAYAYSVNDPRM